MNNQTIIKEMQRLESKVESYLKKVDDLEIKVKEMGEKMYAKQ